MLIAEQCGLQLRSYIETSFKAVCLSFNHFLNTDSPFRIVHYILFNSNNFH